jgi:hypothetical protein
MLLALFSKDLFFDIPGKAEWENSAFTGVSDILSGTLSTLISMILVLVAGMLIYKISCDHSSITGREHLLIWLWIILVGGFSFLHPLMEIHFATIFILLCYNSLFQIYKKTSDYKIIFISSMYLGIATFFCSFSIYLFIPYLIALHRFKIIRFRDWIISIAGFLTPFYFSIFVCHFLAGDWSYSIEKTINNIIPDNFSIGIIPMKTSQYILFIFVFILIAVERLMPLTSRQRINQKTTSFMHSFGSLVLFSIFVFLFFTPERKFMFQIILIPATIYLRMLFIKINKNTIANLLFISLIAISAGALIW